MADCPSCGRYVGPHEACPYCGARLRGRLSIRAVKLAAALLATVGLAALWLAAVHTEPPWVSIGQAGATMNLAYVRVAGRCSRPVTYDPAGEYLSFWLADETGEMRISAYRAETRQILAAGRAPGPGDWVEVAGTLRIREETPSLTINAPDALRVSRADPVERAIGDIRPADEFARVRVRGQVRQVRVPYPGLTLVTLRDASGAIPLAVSDDLVALSGISPTFSVGQSLDVAAAVLLYKETPQLAPASLADVTPLAQAVPIALERSIRELSAADAGRWLAVRGVVSEARPFSAGVKLTLDDGRGALTVVLWQSLYEQFPDPSALDVGAETAVQGELSVYRGELEIAPELVEDVQVLVRPAPGEARAIGDVTSADVGRTLTLLGVLGEAATFSRGVKFPLNDGTGVITLLLWQDVYDAIPGAERLTTGARVEVTGRIDEYRGGLEITPEADGVRILEGK